ncbi:hypothetical protein BO70DRAFT_70217 [Aspergillus heteromorphus CBS 117.55]|uniref:Uncharacterized protein n=1 Tax=Aspergillus heteromorphus CBS 117.55 TaxID=1448321 RepID=A0A317VUI2_9EURO|nr:uncharacterized protein BO70DRAFT_70217 [Aspergillus heteromorphus CBS 117.55]PWY76991.1 hypothetical protein BO70DRAFT_70217 [Aspergillus heteromorphus CBS 117.55]
MSISVEQTNTKPATQSETNDDFPSGPESPDGSEHGLNDVLSSPIQYGLSTSTGGKMADMVEEAASNTRLQRIENETTRSNTLIREQRRITAGESTRQTAPKQKTNEPAARASTGPEAERANILEEEELRDREKKTTNTVLKELGERLAALVRLREAADPPPPKKKAH